MRLIKNAAECPHCGTVLESTHRHDYRAHTCFTAGKISESYDHEAKAYVPDYPMFAVDGGLAYVRRVGHCIERSEYEP